MNHQSPVIAQERQYPPVSSKVQFVRLYSAGVFGNASPTWLNIRDWYLSREFRVKRDLSKYHIRNRVAGGPTFYNLYSHQIIPAWGNLVDVKGVDPNSLYISEMAPHDKGTIQGEIMQDESHLYLRYNFQKLPMREGFAVENLHAWGLEATNLLRHYLCPNSWEWVNVLLDRYPGHIIEFSSFSVNWGTLPGFNSVFWEVRGGY